MGNSELEEPSFLLTVIEVLFPAMIAFCGRLAPFFAIGLFMAPIPTIFQVTRDKTVGALPLLPYSSMVANAFVWVVYGLLRNESKVWYPNSIGVVLGAWYWREFEKFANPSACNYPGTLTQHRKVVGGIMCATSVVALLVGKPLSINLIGSAAVIFCMILFGSPLSKIKTVVTTKSAKSIPISFTLMTIMNCFMWSVVGVLDFNDFNVYFPNLVGLAFGLIQLFLKALYCNMSSTNKKGILPQTIASSTTKTTIIKQKVSEAP